MVTEELCAKVYDMLHVTKPFVSWNLPDSEDVKFVVYNSLANRAEHQFWNDRHTIWVSKRHNKRLDDVIMVMAHEMIHVFEEHVGISCGHEHSDAFWKLAKQVCRIHGFDYDKF